MRLSTVDHPQGVADQDHHHAGDPVVDQAAGRINRQLELTSVSTYQVLLFLFI